MKDKNYKVIIGILVFALVIFNVVIPLYKKYDSDKTAKEAINLFTQLESANDPKDKERIAGKISELSSTNSKIDFRPDAMSASAQRAFTTGGCGNYLMAANSVWAMIQAGQSDLYDAYISLNNGYYNCLGYIVQNY